MREEGRRSEGEGCLRGRRTILRNCCFLLQNIVFRKVYLIVKDGHLIQWIVTQLAVIIRYLQQYINLWTWLTRILSGINMSLSWLILFSCRLFRNRRQTKDNLMRPNIIQAEDTICPGGCADQESTNHLFIICGSEDSLFYVLVSFSHISVLNWLLV